MLGVAEADDGEDTVVGVYAHAYILFLYAREVEVLEEIADEACAMHALGAETVARAPGAGVCLLDCLIARLSNGCYEELAAVELGDVGGSVKEAAGDCLIA